MQNAAKAGAAQPVPPGSFSVDDSATRMNEILVCEAGLPDNYPHQYIKDIEVRGRHIRLRPIHPGDDYRMLMLFNTFSEKTIYHRFFSYIRMPPARVRRFTHVDYEKHMAIVAEELKDGQSRLMGVARYAATKEARGDAEIAIVIGDPWQGRGFGTAMLQYLVEIARDFGYKRLIGLVHFDNDVMPLLFERIGFHHRKFDNGTEWRFEVFTGGEPGE